MEKLLRKNHFWYTVGASLVTLVVGILFTVWPWILERICTIAGIILCVGGVGLVLAYFITKRTKGELLTFGLCALLAGVLLCIIPNVLKFLIPIIFGAWMLGSSLMGMMRNFGFRHTHLLWWVGFLLCTAGAAAGIYILTRPMEIMESTIRIIGIGLIVFSVLRFVSAIMARQYYKPVQEPSDVVETTMKE